MADSTGVRVLLKPPPPPKPVPGMFASSKSPLSVLIATATSWKGIDGGGLRVYSGEKLVAEFAAGAWVAVVVNGVNPADYAELASKLVGQFKDGGK